MSLDPSENVRSMKRTENEMKVREINDFYASYSIIRASGDFIVEFVCKRTALADHRVFGKSGVEDSLEVSLHLK
ncbi:hypothetical protein KIN20_018015 [Parelaphostrongylus tenuis]|uniref:Uncharacterized protein n=1 Tax=Parelaphostrongylus tenuis TaxID=148309 RepID=A0AAD5QR74_PARTN|nr:hypothetical protein KIN20_018015 [Parelaphostrongylus tenuis]